MILVFHRTLILSRKLNGITVYFLSGEGGDEGEYPFIIVQKTKSFLFIARA